MAVVGLSKIKHVNYLFACPANSWVPRLLPSRTAIYPSWFLEPIPDKKTLDELEVQGKLNELRVIPVKPAPNDLTMSVFDDPVVKKFTNMVMMCGNKVLARELMQDTFTKIKSIQLTKYHKASEEEKQNIELNPRTIFHQAVLNCKPALHLIPVKRGGIKYQVPMPITENRSRFMSMKWLINAGRDKDGPTSFVSQLAREILDAYHNEGRVFKRKSDLHKQCEANKAYAHYKWS